MTAGEHEAIAVEPVGLLRIVAQDALPQRVRGWCGAHRSTRMAGVGLLDRIDRQSANGINRNLVYVMFARHSALLPIRRREESRCPWRFFIGIFSIVVVPVDTTDLGTIQQLRPAPPGE